MAPKVFVSMVQRSSAAAAARALADRTQTTVILSRWRWVAVAGALATLVLPKQPAPVSTPALALSLLVVIIYNLPATLVRRLPARFVEPVLALTFTGDFLALVVWGAMLANDPAASMAAVFTVPAFEAALLFRWRGVAGFMVVYLAALIGIQWERATFFQIGFSSGRFFGEVVLGFLVAALAGALSSQSYRRGVLVDREVERSSALATIASRIAHTPKREYVLETVMDSLESIFPWRWHGVLLLTAGEELELAYVRGEPQSLKLPLSATSRYRDSQTAIVMADMWDDPSLRARGLTPPEAIREFRSSIAVPMHGADRLLGVLVTLDRSAGAFADDEVHFLEAVADQTTMALENARLYEEVELRSLTDVTTALLNRRAFDLQMERELDRAKRYQQPLTLLMFDVDHFKNYNDAYGHPAGDVALRQLAQLVSHRTLRKTDFCFRFGGEEFAALLPMTGPAEALELASRLCSIVAAEEFGHGGTLCISAGVASFPTSATAAARLVECADIAMYRAKAEGRNRAALYEVSRG
jgi:diguanylate cyclase (GGDEF)-like protein